MRKFINKHAFVINLILFSFLIAIGFLILYLPNNPTIRKFSSITFDSNKEIMIEIADTSISRALGLSGKKEIDDNYGMLFIFPEENTPSFWMKGMNFSIDIIWVRGNVIVGVDKRVPLDPNVSFQTYSPNQPIDKVLEVNAGFFDRFGLEIGQTLDIVL